ncbi:hypothetical protein DFH09DRAFT_1212293 [Mycena vulgaris]|nr:hypothetical protein DFH09DRAFT_1212293 [Mycena vulgaris]
MYNGKVKLVLVAGNCAPLRKSEPEYYTILSEATVHHFSGTNVALGTAAGKLFRVGSHDRLCRLLRCMLLFPSSQFTDAPHSPLPPRLPSLRAPRPHPVRYLSASPPIRPRPHRPAPHRAPRRLHHRLHHRPQCHRVPLRRGSPSPTRTSTFDASWRCHALRGRRTRAVASRWS